MRWDHFGAAMDCTSWLRKLENVEFRIQKKHQDIFIELGRIAARQFDWQRGFANIPQFHRNAFVYGQGACTKQFEETHGITLNRFSQIGFMLFAALSSAPVVRDDNTWKTLGVAWEEVEKVLALIALPFPTAAASPLYDGEAVTFFKSEAIVALSEAHAGPCLLAGDVRQGLEGVSSVCRDRLAVILHPAEIYPRT